MRTRRIDWYSRSWPSLWRRRAYYRMLDDAYIRRKKMMRARGSLGDVTMPPVLVPIGPQGPQGPTGVQTYIGDVAPFAGLLQLPNGAFEWVETGTHVDPVTGLLKRVWTLIQRLFP